MNAKEVRWEDISHTAGALASDTRVAIIRLLADNPLSVTEIAESLGMPVSSAISAVLKLESGNLISSVSQGTRKICYINYDSILFNIANPGSSGERAEDTVSISIPIGDYSGFSAQPSCGLLGRSSFIGPIDEPDAFLSSDKIHARLIWLRKGYLEYRFQNPARQGKKITRISISMELCAEFPGYNNSFPSDIWLRINGVAIGAFHAEGDFGGRRGIFTPEWWPESSTQYGKLAIWTVTRAGCFINAEKCSNVTIDDLNFGDDDFIIFRVSVDGNGGFNLFSNDFGDYNQDIDIRIGVEDSANP